MIRLKILGLEARALTRPLLGTLLQMPHGMRVTGTKVLGVTLMIPRTGAQVHLMTHFSFRMRLVHQS